MIAINLRWDLTSEEKASLLSKLNDTFNVDTHLSKADQLLFKSSTLSDNQKGIHTKWHLEMTSTEDYFIQLKLCLADVNNCNHLDLTYEIVFQSLDIKRNFFKGNKMLHTNDICQVLSPRKFLNALYLIPMLATYTNRYVIFECTLQIHPVNVENLVRNDVFDNIDCMQLDYEKLLNDARYSDFMLVTPTKKFNVHKNILAVRSEVFSAMFEHDMKEKKEGFAEIKEFSDEIIQELLRYIYCGKVENLNILARDLLVAAEKYLIFALKVLCLEELCKNIKVENAVELLSLVDNYNVEHVKSKLINFIVHNIKDIIDKSNIETIQNVKLWNEILRKTVNEYL